MGTITSGTGLVSGLDTKSIIDQLIAIEGRQKDLVQAKVDTATAQKTAFLQITTQLTSLQITSQSIAKPSFFNNAAATSSNEDVLTATAAAGAAVGSYQFRVARLVQAEQLVSAQFGDPKTALAGAGRITVELGGGNLTQANQLNDLRGGEGVARGQFRVTDRAGHSTVIDLGDAVTLDDVVKKFNTAVDVSVKATIANGRLQLTDATGLLAGNLAVQDLAGTTAAADLGLAGTNATGTLTGTPLAFIGRSTRLASLNDGNGVSDATGNDFVITAQDGTAFNIDLRGAGTLGEVLDKINTTAAGKVVASVNAAGTGIRLTDSTGGGGALAVASVTGNTTAADLGLIGGTGNPLDGAPIQAGLGTVLLKTLNGGAGLTLGTLNIQGRSGTDAAIDLSTAKTLQDVLDAINTSGVGVQAGLNASGNGLQLTDTSGAAGDLIVSGADATTLGLAGTFAATVPVVNGANLQRKWVSASTTLANYNGGRGVAAGEFEITAASGVGAVIELDPNADKTLGDVINKINKAFNGKVVAAINARGDGLSLTDASGGAGTLAVKDRGSSTAANLNLVGKATGLVLDGSMEKTIDVTATDTLEAVQKKIADLNFGLTAGILNDGSGANAYRLSLNATGAGLAGQVTFDSGATRLNTRTLVKAQDAAVFVGSADAGQPLLITSSKNQVTGAVKGVTLNLTSVSTDPVTVSVTNDVTNVKESLTKFVEAYNELVSKIDVYTSFRVDNDTSDDKVYADKDGNPVDPNAGTKTQTAGNTTYRKGILLGDYSVTQIQDQLSSMLQTVVPQGGKYKMLASIGLSTADGGQIAFDEDKFDAAYADDPNAVKALFTTTSAAINNETPLRFLNGGNGVRTAGEGLDDFKAKLKDGTSINIRVGEANTVGDVIKSINNGSGGKLLAELDSNFKLVVSDLTTGTATPALEQLNNSQLMFNLGLVTTANTDGKFLSKKLVSSDPLSSATGGVGVRFQQAINKLINPVDGLIASENKTIDGKITQFQNRITDLNALLDQKRLRLEKQFNNLESVLAKLKTQQSSLGSISSISAAA